MKLILMDIDTILKNPLTDMENVYVMAAYMGDPEKHFSEMQNACLMKEYKAVCVLLNQMSKEFLHILETRQKTLAVKSKNTYFVFTHGRGYEDCREPWQMYGRMLNKMGIKNFPVDDVFCVPYDFLMEDAGNSGKCLKASVLASLIETPAYLSYGVPLIKIVLDEESIFDFDFIGNSCMIHKLFLFVPKMKDYSAALMSIRVIYAMMRKSHAKFFDAVLYIEDMEGFCNSANPDDVVKEDDNKFSYYYNKFKMDGEYNMGLNTYSVNSFEVNGSTKYIYVNRKLEEGDKISKCYTERPFPYLDPYYIKRSPTI